MGQVYTGAYTEGIEVYFLTLLELTCGVDAAPQGNTRRKMGGKVAPGGDVPGRRAAPGRLGDGIRPPLPPGRQPCSGLAVNLL